MVIKKCQLAIQSYKWSTGGKNKEKCTQHTSVSNYLQVIMWRL